jgi:glycosyltransferase involved in cell wall biosynthesis
MSVIAIVGRRDEPTDAVEDYCRLLGGAFQQDHADFIFERVAWNERGWMSSLTELRRVAASWTGDWALLQYTALMWSRRGFPFGFLLVLALLKVSGVRLAVVFHDQGPYAGRRLVDRIRQTCQLAIMRCAYRQSDVAILTYPTEKARWIPEPTTKAASIPIGSNVPVCEPPITDATDDVRRKSITVFAITDSGDISRELADIAEVARLAAQRFPGIRLITLGRGSKEAESRLRRELDGVAVDIEARGLLPAEEISRVLAASDVSLYVRGPISTQRGSAIASIAAGVPLVAYAQGPLPVPLAESGVVDVHLGDRAKLAEAAVRVLGDPELSNDLRERSRLAFPKHFGWEVVAGRFLEVLRIV